MRKSRFIEAQMRLITFDVPTRQQRKTIKSGDISQSLQERIEVLTILEPSSYIPAILKTHPSLPPNLPRHRSALHDAHDLAAEVAVDDRPPWDKRKLMGFLDYGELAAG